MCAIWTHEEAEFHGEYVDFDPIWLWPKPVQQPHPPIAIAGEEVFEGSVIMSGRPTPADVTLKVGPIGPDLDPGSRTTRQVELTVMTPAAEATRIFDFGGDDERVRSFATIAALHLIRLALEGKR